jgi:hypothetical protein
VIEIGNDAKHITNSHYKKKMFILIKNGVIFLGKSQALLMQNK